MGKTQNPIKTATKTKGEDTEDVHSNILYKLYLEKHFRQSSFCAMVKNLSGESKGQWKA